MDSDHAQTLARLGIRSVMIVRLEAGAERYGTLTVSSDTRSYTEDDLAFLKQVAFRVAAFMDHQELLARLHETVRVREELMSVASHEVRTPLTSIRLLMDLLLTLAGDGEKFKNSSARVLDVLRRAVEQVNQCTSLLDQLLDLSRVESGKLELVREPVDLGDLAEDAVRLLMMQAKSAGVSVEIERTGELGALGDGARLRQVLVNLLGNAVKYGKGSPVRIRVDRVGSLVRTQVIDRGPGIPAECSARIFDRFDRGTASQDGRGHGMGLYIARAVVTAHNGSIRVEPTEPSGATFVVEIPVAGTR